MTRPNDPARDGAPDRSPARAAPRTAPVARAVRIRQNPAVAWCGRASGETRVTKSLTRIAGAALFAVFLAACARSPDATASTDPSGAFGAGAGAGALDPRSVEFFNVEVGDRVFFAFDSSALDNTARATLTRQAQWLAQNPGMSVTVEGHADERGTREYNLALGARRAQAARDFLAGQGVSPQRIRTVSFGKERPVATCSNESCWSQNRRAVTVVAGAPMS
ncbi:MAG: peptidoglycan-associated lipoprotein Pal [Rhodobacteraceae bacterium]|nr:MAG: peptidoglycan-associated lipoprotein Pal [Paracoccaceae bacterium]